jgi:hypothetical protein
MKRILSVFFIVCAVSMALMGGLAVLPHAHGHDFDHSQHKACPVYQLSLHSHDGLAAESAVFVVLFAFTFLAGVRPKLISEPQRYFLSPRAPPAAS